MANQPSAYRVVFGQIRPSKHGANYSQTKGIELDIRTNEIRIHPVLKHGSAKSKAMYIAIPNTYEAVKALQDLVAKL